MNDEYTRITAPPALRHHYGQEGQDVYDFHKQFLVPMSHRPALLDPTSRDFRVKFMQEELNEFVEACEQADLLKAADALVDLVYVALGTALMMGLPWRSLWNRVQRANMQKERAKDDGSNSARGSPLDVIKPPGWTPPDHAPDLGTGPRWNIFDARYISEMIARQMKQQATGVKTEGPALARLDSVEVDANGKRHWVSVAEPGSMRTETKA